MMGVTSNADSSAIEQSRIALLKRYSRQATVGMLALVLLCVEPAAAQSIGEEFCETDMAVTIKNIFTLIQFGGPLVGGTLALGAAVATPMVRQADTKMELKQIRTQGLIWGVIIAPLATTIVQFLLSSVVSGGTSCSF
ncbi:hypothetical protein NDI54_20885 [Haloarcula sp. S1AR25-5A]|uniref:Uncharacterized protein n=1 Tax=Haloarcula terrestris TaxID=2950533 RepID=A0AAE4F2P3_9EURY|nr:hypothetical protein [Haloarcula terrestris]MDS0223787.1 hypothetical protein [Haloarcula terrestris]